jgi:hypothetical protein
MSATITTVEISADQQRRIDQARARLQAASLRVVACSQDQLAAGYMRQAGNPIYAGQSEHCAGMAVQAESYAARTRAEADLVEAEAGL